MSYHRLHLFQLRNLIVPGKNGKGRPGKKHNEFVHHLDKLNLQHGVSYGRKKIQYQSLIWFSKNSKTNVIFSHTKIIYFATELLERSTKLKAPKNRTVTRSISNVINRSEERL